MPPTYTHGRVAVLTIDTVEYGAYVSDIKWPRERKTDTVEVVGGNPPVKLDGPIDGDLTFDIVLHDTALTALHTLLTSNAEAPVIYGPQGSTTGAIKISNTGKVAKIDYDTSGSKAGKASIRMSITAADTIGAYA